MGTYYSTPSPIIVSKTFILTITTFDEYFIYSNYYLNVNSNNFTNYTITSNSNGTSNIIFNNVIINSLGNYTFRLYGGINPTGILMLEGNVGVEPVCYLKGTKILCLIDNIEQYINIEDIKPNTLIKTYNYGYKQIKILGWNKFKNTSDKNISKPFKLHKLSKSKNKDLFDDLYVSGQHSILVDNIDDKYNSKIMEKWTKLLQIEDKHLLMAYVSDDFEEILDDNEYELFHIILDNPLDIKKQFGIWTNGILSESMSESTFKKKSRLFNYYDISGLTANDK
jgi:hypothetical protein